MTALVLDHLWQSTILALGLGLLALALRRASAAVRYGLWLSASAKFLIPFALLAALGRLIGPAIPLPAQATPEAAFIEQAAQPFSQPPVLSQAPIAQRPDHPGPASHASVRQASAATPPAPADASAIAAAPRVDLGWMLLTVWALGSAAVLTDWSVRWTRLRRVRRSARRLDWSAPMPVLAAPSLVEPGLLGLWRPVLLIPETLPERLSQAEIDALLAHEACHLRRRDNLAAALHMLVEALFWFHPLAWWIGARLIEERERACDEAVVRAGHDRAAYARSLVEICRLYLQSPLDCAAGASGSNLKARVEAIMTAPPVLPLSPIKKALLLGAGAVAFATPVAAGLLTPEAQKAVAPLARAVAAIAAPAHALEPLAGPGQDQVSRPVALARNGAILAPSVVVAATDAAPMALAQTAAAPAVEQTASQPVRVGEDSARQATEQPADPKAEALAFVQSYAAATAKRQAIARWVQPICVSVVGLADRPDDPQETVVRQRIEAVAKEVGIETLGGGTGRCGFRTNIEIGFTYDPQAMLESVIKTNSRSLGDASSDTRSARTVTLPVQAWYETNGKDVAANDAGDLKAQADYRGDSWAALKTEVQYSYNFPGSSTPSSNMGIGGGTYSGGYGASGVGGPGPGALPSNPARALWAKRQFINAFVIVDLKRTGRADLRVLADYAAMLALSQPKSLGSCQALPSITDLFASCPGRAAPTGLTSADMAYLHALYAGDEKSRADHPAVVAGVVDGMAARLADARPVAPAAWRGPSVDQPSSSVEWIASAPPPARPASAPPLFQLANLSSPDLSRQARDFVQANARVDLYGYLVHWQVPMCLRVTGLTPEQNAAVMSRFQAVAQTLSESVFNTAQACPRRNISIIFSTEPQRMLDAMVARDPRMLGDTHSSTRGVKTVTRPIQMWIQTQCVWVVCVPERVADSPVAATVLVDARRIDDAKLGTVADYVAMLLLADPRALGQCQALPSVLDLFADCQERPTPTGLTRGDIAYLRALYTGGNRITLHDWTRTRETGTLDQVAGRMGMLLSGSGYLPSPSAAPERRPFNGALGLGN
jgi:beta-lactamase regulating signal transducer with metallopeptidase domain